MEGVHAKGNKKKRTHGLFSIHSTASTGELCSSEPSDGPRTAPSWQSVRKQISATVTMCREIGFLQKKSKQQYP